MAIKLSAWSMLACMLVTRFAAAASVGGLQCEARIDPQGIDTPKPLLSWIIQSDRRGEVQTGYQVLVASTPQLLAANQGDLWDSGQVASNQTAQVEYAGRALVSLTPAFWKVRVWDRERHPSDWSGPALWSMGLLSPSDWTARWISDPILADPANRPLMPVHCYRSELASRADSPKWVVLDLGSARQMDSLNLMPARPLRENSDFRTVMFPVRFKVEAADNHDFNNAKMIVDQLTNDYPDPRADSCRFTFPAISARYVRLNVTTLSRWDGQDYGLALGGLAIFNGQQVISVGAGVECSDSIESDRWSSKFLVDGKQQVRLVDSPALDAGVPDVRKKFTVSRVPMLRRDFSLTGKIRRATLSATARGFYEMRINGQRVSNDLLAPGFTDYGARLEYQNYDVTALLKRGPNAIGAMIGYGWYAGHMNLFDMRCIYGYFPQLLAQLDVEMEDGTRVTIGTDGQWRSTLDGPVRWSDLLDGEGYDCTREMAGWDQAGFNDYSWQPAWSQPRDRVPLVWDRCQPVRVIREFQPVHVKQVKAGVYVFDFGQEFTGWCRLRADGPAGTHVKLRHTEMVKPDGNIDPGSLQGTLQGEDYILDGKGDRTLEPHFTYHGFRYVELSGLPGDLKPDTLIGINTRSAVDVTGQFECSNAQYNQIYKAAQWTQANMLFDVPNGCAARAERLAWMGDIRSCVPSLLFNFDASALLTKYVSDIRDAQQPQGQFTDIAPHAHLTGTTVCVGTPGWADAGVSLPWDLYVSTGNVRMLSEHYEAARRWVDFVHDRNPDLLWRNAWGQNWGDWLSPGAQMSRDVGCTAFFAHSTDLVSRMARALGKTQDAERYQTLFQGIRQAFMTNFVSATGIIADPTPGPKDVTEIVRSLVKNGKLPLTVTNDVFGGDPAPNRIKTLHLTIRRGDKSELRDFTERSTATLGEDGPVEIVSATYGDSAAGDPVDAQGSYTLALRFNLLDEPLRTLAARRLDALVTQNKFHPTTGYWSSGDLLPALSDNGYHSDAAEMVNQRDEPSWGYMANFNTTFWESFDADKTKISLNHWPHSAVSGWMWNNIAGINPDEQHPGYQTFTIYPRPSAQVSWCKATYHSIRGEIVSNWTVEKNSFKLTITVPPDCKATVYVPARDARLVQESNRPIGQVGELKLLRYEGDREVIEVDSGQYEFTSEVEPK